MIWMHSALKWVITVISMALSSGHSIFQTSRILSSRCTVPSPIFHSALPTVTPKLPSFSSCQSQLLLPISASLGGCWVVLCCKSPGTWMLLTGNKHTHTHTHGHWSKEEVVFFTPLTEMTRTLSIGAFWISHREDNSAHLRQGRGAINVTLVPHVGGDRPQSIFFLASASCN